jgi:hypothetical protein
MPNLATRFSEFIHANPPWPWPWLRNTNITDAEREIFEHYGETVISMQVRGSFVEDAEHAREWLKERTRSRQRRETITFILEIAVVLLILGEILLALRQERLQSLNFKEQQQTQTKNFNEQQRALTTLQMLCINTIGKRMRKVDKELQTRKPAPQPKLDETYLRPYNSARQLLADLVPKIGKGPLRGKPEPKSPPKVYLQF